MAKKTIMKLIKINVALVVTLGTLITGCTIGQNTAGNDVLNGNDVGLVCISNVDETNGVVYAFDCNNRVYTYYTDDFDICVDEWYTCVYDRETLEISVVRYERPDMLYDLMD